MKKAVLVIAALVVFTSFTFAQATVGAWGRGLFVPVLGADGDVTSAVMTSWGPGGPRVGVTISGSSDNVGFQLDFNGDNGGVNAGDQQKIWVKPIDMLTIQVGRIFDDTLRGNAVFGAWNWLRYAGMAGEDAIFARVGVSGEVNAEIAVAPVEGAYIFAAFGGNGQVDLINPPATFNLAEDMLKYGQYGAAYTIEGIGQIRLQYFGMMPQVTDDWGLINAAFKLTMIEGLTVDLGAAIPTDKDEAGDVAQIMVYGSYAMDALTAHVYADIILFDGTDAGFGGAVGIDYSLEGGLGINADVRYKNDVESGNPDGEFSGMIGVTKGFSNGLIGIALEITTGYFADWTGNLIDKTDASAMAFALPIRLEYWF